MGDFSTSLFCMIFLSVFIVCDSLPFPGSERQDLDQNPDGKRESTQLYVEQSGPTLAMEHINEFNNSIENKNTFSMSKFIKDVEDFTRQIFRILLQLEGDNKQYDSNSRHVIQGDSNDISVDTYRQPELTSKQRHIARKRNKSLKTHTKKLKDIIKDSVSDNSHIDKDQTIPKHRKHRERRSFLHDYGLALSYTDGQTDVIFGAHTSPCAYRDRHYCLNGGTCVFVGALEIKTCQCKIGYTGLRCQSINQEFLMALLSEEFFG